MKPLQLSEIVGLRVKCSKCPYEEQFEFPLKKPIGPHMCPAPPDKPKLDEVPVLETVFMDEVGVIASTIQARRAGRFELTFLLKDSDGH